MEVLVHVYHRPPISVQLRIQDEFFFFEDPLLARWDEEQKCWRQDGFMDTSFVEGETFDFVIYHKRFK